jgi:flavin reductase (DIM6/NTAB) family NADH-FMN oxidoreductase RutF
VFNTRAARQFASGVTLVTTRCDEVLHAGTVSAFFSLSLEPLQVLISLNSAGRLAELVTQSGIFGVNVLSAEQELVSRLFVSPQGPTSLGALPGLELSEGGVATPTPGAYRLSTRDRARGRRLRPLLPRRRT